MSIVEELYNKIDDGREGKNVGLKRKTKIPITMFYSKWMAEKLNT